MNSKPTVDYGVRRLVGAVPASVRGIERQSCDKSQHSILNRRAFFRTVLLAGLGWLAVTLLRRSCTNRSVCGSCPAYAGCDLPWRKEAGS